MRISWRSFERMAHLLAPLGSLSSHRSDTGCAAQLWSGQAALPKLPELGRHMCGCRAQNRAHCAERWRGADWRLPAPPCVASACLHPSLAPRPPACRRPRPCRSPMAARQRRTPGTACAGRCRTSLVASPSAGACWPRAANTGGAPLSSRAWHRGSAQAAAVPPYPVPPPSRRSGTTSAPRPPAPPRTAAAPGPSGYARCPDPAPCWARTTRRPRPWPRARHHAPVHGHNQRVPYLP